MRSRGVLDQKYIFEYEVGLFPFGTCRVLRDRSSNELRNCKVVPKSNVRNPGAALERLKQLQGLQGTHIAPVTDVLEDSSSLYIISEHCAGGDVGDWMDRLNENDLLEEQTCTAYVRQAVLALSQSHSQNVFHYDLQPQNMLLTSKMPDATVKVNDIGLAYILDPDGIIMQRHGQSSPYVAPEVRDGIEPLSGGAPDMWSIGAIAHQLLVGAAPNDGGGAMDWLSRLSGRRTFDDIWAERSAEARDFVEALLRPSPGQRITAARALQHPWLRSLAPAPLSQRSISKDDSDTRQNVLCYMLAVLLIPVVVPYKDFQNLHQAFLSQDKRSDGFNSQAAAHRILMSRCSFNEAVSPALAIADISKSGSVDLCTISCADLIAREFFAAGPTGQPLSGPFHAADLAPRMLKRFFEIFGQNKQPSTSVENIRSRLRTATARDMERYAGVSYGDVVGSLPEGRQIDSQVLKGALSANAGLGTPLNPVESTENPQESDDFNMGFMGFFHSCGATDRDESPFSISVDDDGRSRGRRRQRPAC